MSDPRRKANARLDPEDEARRRLACRPPASAGTLRADAGQPLEPAVRAQMEAALGHDFSRVRVHDGGEAADSARSVGAAAYTRGSSVVFGAGRFQPGTASGRRLIAHELAHVVQQAGSGGSAAGGPGTGPAAARGLEREARDAAGHAAGPAGAAPASAPALSVGVLGGPALQREPVGPMPDTTLRYSPGMAHGMGSTVLDGFATGSPRLTPAHRGRLADLGRTLVELIRQYPHAVVTITGHADAPGDDVPNEALGTGRAEAVRDALTAAGVPAANLAVRSEGEGSPAVPGGGDQPGNRRVEIDFRPESGVRLAPELSLSPPGPAGAADASTRPPVDMDRILHPRLEDLVPPGPLGPRRETGEEAGRRIFRPVPEAPPRPTVGEMVWGAIDREILNPLDRALAPVLSWIPEAIRPSIRDAARSLAERGETAALEAALDAANIHGDEREAIMTSIRAAIRQAGQARP